MISYCCSECLSFDVYYDMEMDYYYCHDCDNYTIGRVKRWD